jgi:hypothetical protein
MWIVRYLPPIRYHYSTTVADLDPQSGSSNSLTIVINHDSAQLADHSGTTGLQSINWSKVFWIVEQRSSSTTAMLKSGLALGSFFQ